MYIIMDTTFMAPFRMKNLLTPTWSDMAANMLLETTKITGDMETINPISTTSAPLKPEAEG